MKRSWQLAWILALAWILTLTPGAEASELHNSLNLYWGRLSSNHWEEVLQPNRLDLVDSYLFAAAYARRLGKVDNWLSFEAEGQLVRHYRRQVHWEINALATVRWEPFIWDRWLDTSLAFGLGPSLATRLPEVEVENDGGSRRFLAFWMMEVAFSLPEHPRLALIARLHHRSNAYGLLAERGGYTAPAIGIKYRF